MKGNYLTTFIVALFLTCTVNAQTPSKIWDFTALLNAADEDDINKDKEYAENDGMTEVATWYRVPLTDAQTGEYKGFRYGIGRVLTKVARNDFGEWIQLYANGHVLDYTKGLWFAKFNGPINVKSIRIEPGNRMNINVSKMGLKIKDLKAGDKVRVLFATAGKNIKEGRYFEITNGTSTEADSSRITSFDYSKAVLGEITVTNDGDLLLNDSKGVYIYKISINAELTLPKGLELEEKKVEEPKPEVKEEPKEEVKEVKKPATRRGRKSSVKKTTTTTTAKPAATAKKK